MILVQDILFKICIIYQEWIYYLKSIFKLAQSAIKIQLRTVTFFFNQSSIINQQRSKAQNIRINQVKIYLLELKPLLEELSKTHQKQEGLDVDDSQETPKNNLILQEITLIMSKEQPNKDNFLTKVADYICPCFGYKQQKENAMKQKQVESHNTTESNVTIFQDQTHYQQLFNNQTVEVKPQKSTQFQQQQDELSQDKIRESPVVLKFDEEDSQIKDEKCQSIKVQESIDYQDVANMQLQFQQYMQQHQSNKQSRQPKIQPVQKYSQNKLIVLGSGQGRMLAKIKKVLLQPSKTSVNLQRSAKNNAKEEHSNNPTIQKYWEKRYILFQKFDEGIKLDTQSWYSVTPQAVAQHVASKLAGFDCVLDAFAGAGGDSIQLSLNNKQVISNDIDAAKIELLINNAAVYGVDNINTLNQDYFQLEFGKGQIGAVYMSPPWGGIQYYEAQSIKPEQMTPPLQQIVRKALSISENIGLLLPTNMNIELLVKNFSCIAEELNILSSCSLIIEKIYFQDRFKFLLVLFGNRLTGINLGDQLEYIYSLLATSKSHFNHKRVIKKLREDIGMIKVLNLALQCQRVTPMHRQPLSSYDLFVARMLKQNLISQQKLQKLDQMDQRDESYRSKQTSKAEKLKLKLSLPHQNQANTQGLKAENLGKEDRPINNTVKSIVNSSGFERTVSYISEISESKLAATLVNQPTLPQKQQLSSSVRIQKQSQGL